MRLSVSVVSVGSDDDKTISVDGEEVRTIGADDGDDDSRNKEGDFVLTNSLGLPFL